MSSVTKAEDLRQYVNTARMIHIAATRTILQTLEELCGSLVDLFSPQVPGDLCDFVTAKFIYLGN
jgi:hypothetical protein